MRPIPSFEGYAANLARPGANVTGVTVDAGGALPGKRLSLLLEMRPGASRLIYLASAFVWSRPQAAMVREAAQHARVTLMHIDLGPTLNDAAYSASVAMMEDAKADLVLVSNEPEHLTNRSALVNAITKVQLPAMYSFRELVQAGGLMAYYSDLSGVLRQAGDQVARILGGENPAEMPFRQPTNFKLSINTRTAQQIGVTVPPTLLASADEVIE